MVRCFVVIGANPDPCQNPVRLLVEKSKSKSVPMRVFEITVGGGGKLLAHHDEIMGNTKKERERERSRY
jgi:hypothetical protein